MRQFILMVNELAEISEKLKPVLDYTEKNKTSGILIHAFLGDWSIDHACMMSEEILKDLPDAMIVGNISCGEIYEGNLAPVNYLLVVSVFESAKIQILSYHMEKGNEAESARVISADIDARPEAKALEIFATVRAIDFQSLLEQIRYRNKKLPVFGAGVSGVAKEGGEVFLIVNREVITSGLVAVFYVGEDFHIHLEQIFGWKPMGLEMKATKAGGQSIQEINDKPAYEVYRHYLKIPRAENFLAHTLGFPFLTEDREIPVLRVPHACTDDGTLLFSADVSEGSRLRLTYGNLSEIYNEVSEKQEYLRQFVPQAILLYDCATRKMFWQMGIDQELFPFQRLAPTAGFFCEGELKGTENGLIVNHQCSLVAVGMREGEKGSMLPARKRVEELKFFTDSSIMKRMGTFIQMTTEELEDANQKLVALNRDLNRANEQLSYMAVTDELTKLFNRREIERRIHQALEEVKDERTVLSILMMDIDFFKKVNDTYGHAVGDIVLKDTAALIRSCLDESKGEAAGRWGGEEFLVLLPNTSLAEAAQLAEKIRTAVAGHVFEQAGHRTLSLGVTCTNGNEDEKQIFIRADDALYRAKEGGRNRVVVRNVE